MWIGVAIVVAITGDIVTDAKGFKTEADCKSAEAQIAGNAEQSQKVLAYKLDCFEAKAVLTVPRRLIIDPPKLDAKPDEAKPEAPEAKPEARPGRGKPAYRPEFAL